MYKLHFSFFGSDRVSKMEQTTPFRSARRGKWQPTPNIFAFSHETKGTLALRYFVEVTMPKSKIYASPSAEDPSTNGTVTEHSQAIGVVPLKKSGADSPGDDHATGVAAGRLPEEVYANTMSWRRAALRRRCVAVVEWETEVIATWQVLLSSQIEGRWKGKSSPSLLCFAGACPVALAGHVFPADFDARHAHFLSRLPPRVLLFWAL